MVSVALDVVLKYWNNQSNHLQDLSLFQVQAIYDFSGEPGTAELSIKTGDVLTVTRKDVGEGWWEGRSAAGQTGLFPAAYVQVS